MLWMLQRVALGEPSTKAAGLLPDLSYRELATVIPLAIMVLWIGLYPGPLMEMMDASVTNLVQQMASGPSPFLLLPLDVNSNIRYHTYNKRPGFPSVMFAEKINPNEILVGGKPNLLLGK